MSLTVAMATLQHINLNIFKINSVALMFFSLYSNFDPLDSVTYKHNRTLKKNYVLELFN